MARTCTSCGVEHPPDARFCHRCGAASLPACVACGADLAPDALFCSRCGSRQGAESPVGASSAPVADRRVTERRVTSVLFGDLVGFTTLSEQRDQEEVRDLLSRYFDEARLVIGRYNGVVEKFIGDAVMAVWGVPTAHEDDAERAVRAGLELVQGVAALGEDLGVPGLALRVGIVTGEVAVTLGADGQGMVAGDAVNTAARIQSAAEPGHVWVDERTRLLTGSAVSYLDAGLHALKGKADPVPLWSVRAVVAALGGAQRADGLEAPLVGRGRELRLLKEVFHGVEETSTPALVVVDGEPGTGKTRLAWEFEKYADGLGSTVRWHSGRCLAYGEGVAFFALAEAVRGRLAAADPDLGEVDDVERLVDSGLTAYVADPDEREWLRPRLGVLLGAGGDTSFRREELFTAWTTFLRRVGDATWPVALVIDDAQHADEGMLQFLEHLIGVDSFACFALVLTRPGLIERHPGLATNRRSTVVHLGALTRPDMAAMLDGLVAGLPGDVRDTLVARAEGVPLFAIETVRSLIDRDLVVPRGGLYQLSETAALDLDSIAAPASLQALIAARLDTLPPSLREVVVQASVLGGSFPREAIALLCPGVPDLDDVLTGLVRLQILGLESSRLSSEYGEYQFVQSAFRQVAYATLSRRDRKAGHLRVAALYESADESAGDLTPIIAQHYVDALDAVPNDPDVDQIAEAAVAALRRAATRSRALGVPDEAAAHLTVALERAREPGSTALIEADLAWALLDAGRYAEARAHAVTATRELDEAGDQPAAALAAAAEASALALGMNDNQGALAVAEPRWESLADQPGAAPVRLVLARVISSARQRVGLDNRDVLEARIRLAEQLGDHGDLADSFTELSRHYMTVGARTVTRVMLEAAADLARTHHRPFALARALSDLTADTLTEDLDRAAQHGREAVAAASSAGVKALYLSGRANLALALWTGGEWDELSGFPELAEPEVDPSDTGLWRSLGGLLSAATGTEWCTGPAAEEPVHTDDPVNRGWAIFAHSLVARQAGRPGVALESAMAAADTFYELYGVWDDLVHVWSVAADLALETGNDVDVERLLRMLGEDGVERLPVGLRGHWAHLHARLAARDGAEEAEVERRFREAVLHLDSWGARPSRARVQADLGRWLVGRGREAEGAELLAAARATYADLGAAAWLRELEPASSSSSSSGGRADRVTG